MEVQFSLADHVLWGLDDIARYMHVSRRTVRRWIDDISLPAAQTPAGTWITTTHLIDQWILAMNQAQMEAKRKERHFQDLIERTQ